MPFWKPLATFLGAAAAAGVVCAAAIAPAATVAGVGISHTQETMVSNLADLTDGSSPGVTTILDSANEPIAWIYKQRRYAVGSDQIAPIMKKALVSIEDRRFYEHAGVDWQGTARAMVRNLLSGTVMQGASTIDQQYVKNYLLLVDADNDAEQAAAVETSIPRKLREMRMASDLDRNLPKDAILTRYLNVVPFGNGAYGIEAAARTYFGIPAKDLSPTQAAMLAGMVQSTAGFNPYADPEAVLERRNTVLDTMAETGAITPQEAAQFKTEPLGVVEHPEGLPNGCITAGNRGFFCDYVLKYLAEKGYDLDRLHKGSYTITTTLDPQVQETTHAALTQHVPTQTPGVAEVMSVVQPGTDSRRVVAMTSSRDYGLELDSGQTVLGQPFDRVGAGAGSVFKIFTAAAALQKGMGSQASIPVPRRLELQGMGEGGAKNCPPGTYCVENDGSYPSSMSLQEALAQSPNTAFVSLIDRVGVPDVVDLSVKMGLRSYLDPGSFDGQSSIADYVKEHNLGSYTLGPTPVSGLELSNVGATIASGGMWCEPSPIEKIVDARGAEVHLDTPACEQALEPGVANALQGALSEDTDHGTAAEASKAAGWGAPLAAKTGTTETHQSAAFIGFNSGLAAATYIYNDGTTNAPLCTSPLRQCGEGDLYGGKEPARSWFSAGTKLPPLTTGSLPPVEPQFRSGTAALRVPDVKGLTVDDARKRLERAGFSTVTTAVVAGRGMPEGRVVSVDTSRVVLVGDPVTLNLSDGSATPASTTPTPPPLPSLPSFEAPAPAPGGDNNPADDIGQLIEQLLNPEGGR